MSDIDYSKPFTFHGVELTNTGSQFKGDCFLCGKENHFYVSPKTGQWDCKSCGEKGNVATFLRLLHESFLGETTDEDYRELAKLRVGIPAKAFRRYGIALNSITGSWLIPIYNAKGKLANLRAWDSHKGVNYSTPTCATHAFLIHKIKENTPIMVVEGEWDAMALEHLLRQVDAYANHSVVAVPGATTFKEDWAKYFANRDVYLLYDHDEAGANGIKRAVKVLTGSKDRPKSIRVLRWPESLPEKYDVRDFVGDHKGRYREAWLHMQERFVPIEDTPVSSEERFVRNTFLEVLKDFEDEIHVTESFRVSLAICLATALAVRLPGDPLWVFLVGPPGSGKTLLLNAFGNSEYTEAVSKITPRTLVSGWKSADGSDASFLPQLNGRILVIKDYTAVKSMPAAEQEELYGVLRDAFDGSLKFIFGNKEIREFHDFTFGIVAGVTDVIHGDQRATLGERFLKVELLEDDYDPHHQIMAAMSGIFLKDGFSDKLRKSVLGYLDKKIDHDNLPVIPDEMKLRLASLAELVGHMRATVHRTKERDLQYRPRAEIGSRVAVQLYKMGICLCLVFDLQEANEKVYRYLYKLAMDTARGFNLDICQFLFNNKSGGASNITIQSKLNISKATATRRLNDLLELRILKADSIKPRGSGRPTLMWKLSDKMLHHWTVSLPKPATKVKQLKRRRKRATSSS
jgi:predicted transcriptional regulator